MVRWGVKVRDYIPKCCANWDEADKANERLKQWISKRKKPKNGEHKWNYQNYTARCTACGVYIFDDPGVNPQMVANKQCGPKSRPWSTVTVDMEARKRTEEEIQAAFRGERHSDNMPGSSTDAANNGADGRPGSSTDVANAGGN